MLVNAQVTRTFTKGFDVYLGGENLFGYTQHHPILDAVNPNSKYFDSSLIWGPIYGRMVYLGVRWKV